jgi:hypothetical protein
MSCCGYWNYGRLTNGGSELVTAVTVIPFTFSMTASELGMSADDITSIKSYEKGLEKGMRMLCVMHDLEIVF